MKALAIADSDSYVKWGAATLDGLPGDWDKDLVVLRTPVVPSAGQLTSALIGTGLEGSEVRILDLPSLAAAVAREAPDVVLLSARGPAVRVIVRAIIAKGGLRPVFVSGVPGIALPAKRKALVFRSQVDLIVLHSVVEDRAYRARARETEIEQDFALSTLAFLSSRSASKQVTPPQSQPTQSQPTETLPTETQPTDIVFASQARVPPGSENRLLLLGWLAAAARAHPERRVIVKLRAAAGERQTHAEPFPLDVLAADIETPPNFEFATGPMARYLDRAAALVTVSSTAALEAIARDVPTLVLSDFGVDDTMINGVFEGSGLLGDSRDLIAGRFRHADPRWAHDNYFHDPAENTLVPQLEALLARRAGGVFPVRSEVRPSLGGRLRHVWDRRQVLGSDDNTLSGTLALLIGTPLRMVARRIRKVRRVARARASGVGVGGGSRSGVDVRVGGDDPVGAEVPTA